MSKRVGERSDVKELRSKLEEAQKSYRTALEAAMRKEDPELFAKYKEMQAAGPGGVALTAATGFAALTVEEKKRLSEARDKAAQTDEVKAAREKKRAAATEEERKAAESAYDAALRKAILKEDKELEAILVKFDGKGAAKKP